MFKLIKEIKSKSGELHFRRYLLFSVFGLSVCIHRIYIHDRDEHLHDHPWSFLSIVLWGSYSYNSKRLDYDGPVTRISYDDGSRGIGSIAFIPATGFYHRIWKISGPVTSLAIMGKRHHVWGYDVNGHHVPQDIYRARKELGVL